MAGHRTVYLDNNATTQPDPRVVEAMLPFMREEYGNASSRQHRFGWAAEAAVEAARKKVAALVGAAPEGVVFTSGATESINLALKGVAVAWQDKGRHVVTAATEHRAVLDTCLTLERYGFEVTVLPVGRSGRLEPEDVRRAVRRDTILVTVMTANNEIGTIHPIEEIGRFCRERGVLFHTDAVQAGGKIPFSLAASGADLISLSAHKMHGPKGIGALVRRTDGPAIRLAPQIDGGGHEHGLRSGTLNVPAIVGFGVAAAIAADVMPVEGPRQRLLRDRLESAVLGAVEDVSVNGHTEARLPNTSSLSFAGTIADRVMSEIRDIAVSTGSACSTGSPEPSHVLRAIGVDPALQKATLRFSVSRFTTEEEVLYAAGRVADVVRKIRAQMPAGIPA
jgi:cysteine desulfurase